MDSTGEVKEVFIEDEATKRFCEQTFRFEKEGGFSRIEPYNQIFPTGRYTRFQKKIEDFEVFDDDVWVCSHPKSGTRWIMELAWCLKNNVDLEKAKTTPLNNRVPFLEFELVSPLKIDENKLSFDHAATVERPRMIKCHFSYEMLPKQVREKNAKIIYLLRNPRDVCLAYKNHFKSWENYHGDYQIIVDMFLNDAGPYYGPFFKNILGYWQRKDQPNILILHYEDMLKDLPKEIKKLAEFLEVKISDVDMERLCEHVSFDSMKGNHMVNLEREVQYVSQMQKNENPGKMINEGKSGGWRNRLDEATIKRFEEWEAKWLKDTGLQFSYE